MNTRHKGAIAVARAIAYFSSQGEYVFLPVGDNGGAIDLIVSPDGRQVRRVQCKYTQKLHTASKARGETVWDCNLRTVNQRTSNVATVYQTDAFDLLFIATPGGDYLFDWPALCGKHGCPPSTVRMGKRNADRLVHQPMVATSSTAAG